MYWHPCRLDWRIHNTQYNTCFIKYIYIYINKTTGHPSWIQAGSKMQSQRVCPQMVHRHGPPGRQTSCRHLHRLQCCVWHREPLFLDGALAETGISSNVRHIVQAIFAAATGVVRIRQQDGGVDISEPFNIERGVLQGISSRPCASSQG